MFPSSSYLSSLYSVFLKSFSVMKITISFLFEHSPILTISIIDVERSSNYSFNLILSLGHIPFFHFVTIMLYI